MYRYFWSVVVVNFSNFIRLFAFATTGAFHHAENDTLWVFLHAICDPYQKILGKSYVGQNVISNSFVQLTKIKGLKTNLGRFHKGRQNNWYKVKKLLHFKIRTVSIFQSSFLEKHMQPQGKFWRSIAHTVLTLFNNRNTRTMCEISWKLDAISIVLVSLLLTLNIFHILLYCFIVNFEQVNASWVWTDSNIENEANGLYDAFIKCWIFSR